MTLPLPQSRLVRFRCHFPADLVLEDGTRLSAHILDLSLSGAFVEADLDLQLGERVQVLIQLPDGVCAVEAEVARLGKSQLELAHDALEHLTVLRLGAALRFVHLEEAARGQLQASLSRLEEE